MEALMKTFYLSMIGFFCFLSVAWGAESLQLRSGETITGTIESASSTDKSVFLWRDRRQSSDMRNKDFRLHVRRVFKTL